jgi:hypothetical protein
MSNNSIDIDNSNNIGTYHAPLFPSVQGLEGAIT